MKIEKIISKYRIWKLRNSVSQCGKNPQVFGKIYINTPASLTIGDDFRINDGCKLIGRNGSRINIGNDVTISNNAIILSTGYDIENWMSGNGKKHKTMETVIGDHVWICANSVICGGVRISGKYVVIAAGAVVTDDITEDYCLYAGVPAKLIKKYDISKGAKHEIHIAKDNNEICT